MMQSKPWLHLSFCCIILSPPAQAFILQRHLYQGWKKQFHIGQAKYKQHVRHLNVRVVLEHDFQKVDVLRLIWWHF